MFKYINIIKGNYLQYARTYSFLFTIGISLIIAFGFIPAPDANYVTVKFGDFTGEYNSAWIGFVTAILSSTILSLFGFFLISGSIKRDIDSRIGHIIGSTRISNAIYIFSKIMSNFLVLLSILGIIFLVSICLFFLYSEGYPFLIMDFITPFLLIAIPSLFFTASIAVILEVIFPKFTFMQYGIFLIIYFAAIFSSSLGESMHAADIFGITHPTNFVTEQIQNLHPNQDTGLTIGFVKGSRNIDKLIELNKLPFPNWYSLNRLIVLFLSLGFAFIASFFFHRFDIKRKIKAQNKEQEIPKHESAGFQLNNLNQALEFKPEIMPLVKAELTLLLRNRSKWLLILTVSGMVAMLFVSNTIAHQFILPLLWFLQVTLWSDLFSKDFSLRTNYFTASSYKPLQRLFVSRVLAGFLVAMTIALPLLLKQLISFDITAFINIILGGAFIVLLAVFLGVVTKGKKLYEVIFFFMIYCNLNSVTITDYFGAFHSSIQYTLILLVVNILLFTSSQFLKGYYDR